MNRWATCAAVTLMTTSASAQSPQSAASLPAAPPSHQVTIDTSTPALRLEWERKVGQMIRRGELKLREEQTAPGQPIREQWFDQLYKGVPVLGSDVWRSLEAGKMKSLEGSIFVGITVNPVPKLTRAEALTAIGALAASSPGPSLAPALVVMPRPDGTFVLVYQARVLTATDLTLYSIDASTGEVVASEADPGPPPQ